MSKLIKFILNNKFLFLILILQLVLANHFLSISEIFNEKTIINHDYPFVYYRLLTTRNEILTGIFNWYDPSFFAGYDNNIFGLTNYIFVDKLLLLISLILPISLLPIIFKLYAFFIVLIIPFIFYLTSRNFGLEKNESLVAAILASIIFQLDRFIHAQIYVGVTSFLVASLFSFLSASFFYRYLNKPKNIYLILSFITALYALSTHFLSIAFSLLSFLILLISRKKFDFKIYFIIFILTIFLSGLIVYLLPKFIQYSTPTTFDQGYGLESITNNFKQRFLLPIVFIAGLIGLYLWGKNKEKNLLFKLFLCLTIFYFVYTYFGSFSYIISYSKPLRFEIYLIMILILPFSSSIIYLFKKSFKPNLKFLIIFIIIFLAFLIFKKPEYLSTAVGTSKYELAQQANTNSPPYTEKLVLWIKENTTNNARILIEDSGFFTESQYGGVIIFFPEYTKREFIGGPITYTFYKKELNYPIYYEGLFFGDKIDSYSNNELNKYLDLFNIKWIIVWSEESKNIFNKNPTVSKIGEIGKFELFESNIKPSFFIEGGGKINSYFNNVMLTDATSGEITIKYRFVDGLKTYPEMKIEPQENRIGNSTFNFIKILNGNITSFRIFK